MRPQRLDLIGQQIGHPIHWTDRLEVGDRVRCVNSQGWPSLVKGRIYTVVEIWDPPCGFDIDIGDHPVAVANDFHKDFEPCDP